jgi:four helix bundle protein
MDADEMKRRTRAFALRIIRLVEALPKTRTADVIGKQLVRCGTSVGANYRASCRAKSQADFIAKLGIVEEEANETIYWIELLVESGQVKEELVASLLDEANQLVAIIVSSIRTARGNKR